MNQTATPPGHLIDIGGEGGRPRRMHLWRQGAGRPAAVLDSGLGGNCLMWANVLPALAAFTEAVAFDRAGAGWSDDPPASQPRTSRRMVEELRTALAGAGLAPPYVLLGHSAGAIHNLVFAKRYPAEVAGMVLVDPSHPEMFTRAPGVPSPRVMAAMMAAMAGLGRLGLARWMGPAYMKSLLPNGEQQLPAPAWQAMMAFARQGRDFTAAAREAAAGAESFASARCEPGGLGDLPLVVLSADWWTTGKQTRLKRAFRPLRDEMAAYSTRGQHVIVSGCTHADLPVARPDAVAEAVKQVVEMHQEAAGRGALGTRA